MIELRGVTALLSVYDMPVAIRFYRELLGFDVVSTSPVMAEGRFHWALLRLGGAELMLNTAYEFDEERPTAEDAQRVIGHGDTCLYFACPDVDAAYLELRGRGLEVEQPNVAPYGMKQLSFRDPDGYGICLQWSAAG